MHILQKKLRHKEFKVPKFTHISWHLGLDSLLPVVIYIHKHYVMLPLQKKTIRTEREVAEMKLMS